MPLTLTIPARRKAAPTMTLYAASLLGCKRDLDRQEVTTFQTAWAVRAASDDEAVRLAVEESERVFPDSEGFVSRGASVVEIVTNEDGTIRVRAEY